MPAFLSELFARIVAYLVERAFSWLVDYGRREAAARREAAVA